MAARQPFIAVEEAPIDGKFYVRQNGAWVSVEFVFLAAKILTEAGDRMPDEGGNIITAEQRSNV